MLIGIISDSHENLKTIRTAVDLFNRKRVRHVFHAGDLGSTATFDEFHSLNCPMDLVFGNNDSDKRALRLIFGGHAVFHERRHRFTIDGKTFVMMHEPDNIDFLSQSGGYNCIIYGHTHRVDIRRAGQTLILNPGESCGHRTGQASVIILDTSSMSPKRIILA